MKKVAVIILCFVMNSYAEVWNSDGNMELPAFDTGWMEYVDYLTAPWGEASWGMHCYVWEPSHGPIDACQFTLLDGGPSGKYLKMWAKELTSTTGFGVVTLIQGWVWDGFGPHCNVTESSTCPYPHGSCKCAPWNYPSPFSLSTYGKNLTISFDYMLTTDPIYEWNPPDNWIMHAINVWFWSPELPKRLVMDLAVYLGTGDNLNSFEDNYAYHYQARIYSPNPVQGNWVHVSTDLSYHIDQALNLFNISYAADTLHLAQFEFLIESKNSQSACAVDNLTLSYTTPSPPHPYRRSGCSYAGEGSSITWPLLALILPFVLRLRSKKRQPHSLL